MNSTKYKSALAALALSAGTVLTASAGLAQDAGETPIRIIVGDTVFEGHLNSTTMAQRLSDRLPMTVTFGEHPGGGGFDTKVTHLEPPLSTEGTELGAAPGPGDIALYVPSGNLGFYYGQLRHWPGAVVLGTYEGDPGFFERQTGEFTVTIEVAER
ncbi:cyclophilin-like fold protein [Poseidonocella sp. HB161398]|uniref:cyclophilin-like fold protein n=1 Tax=Poseidonocella sp. HB161398 TaxID=2320855 RepID=UPI001107E864|nr:cyclophilin-like fold protein [Poseidonocella sp. HB161398]